MMNNQETTNKINQAFDIAHNSPELNMNNYSHEDVEKLNDAMIELFNLLDELREALK